MNSSAFLRFQGHSYMTETHTQKDQSPPETEFLEPDGSFIIYTNAYKVFLPIPGAT